MEKKNSGFQTQLVFHVKFQKQELKILKSLFKLFATLEKKKRVQTKTRVRLYKQTKTTSQSLPPDEKSMVEAIKRLWS